MKKTAKEYELLNGLDDLYLLEKDAVLVTKELGGVKITPNGIVVLDHNKNKLASDGMFSYSTSVRKLVTTYMTTNYPQLQFTIENGIYVLPSSENSAQGFVYIFILVNGDGITPKILNELKQVAMNIVAQTVNTESLFGKQIEPDDFHVDPEKVLCLKGAIEEMKKNLPSKSSENSFTVGTGVDSKEAIAVESFKKAEFEKKEPIDVSGYGKTSGFNADKNVIHIYPIVNGKQLNTAIDFHCRNARLYLLVSKAYFNNAVLSYSAVMHMNGSKAQNVKLDLSIEDGDD